MPTSGLFCKDATHIVKTENPKSNTPENVNVKEKTVKTTVTVTDVRLGVMNVLSLGNKLDCVIDHITDLILLGSPKHGF